MAAKPDLESLRTQQAELTRLLASIQAMSASLDPKPAGKGAEERLRIPGMRAHDCGAAFDAGARGWLDVFLCELLLNWFKQHEVLEAQMIRIFDEFDLVRSPLILNSITKVIRRRDGTDSQEAQDNAML